MIDSNDNQTMNIFPVAKKRGRPASAKPKSNATRQAEYRKRKETGGDNGGDSAAYNLNQWISVQAHCALSRLVAHSGLTKAQILEQLIIAADDANLEMMGDWESPAHIAYVNQNKRNV